MEGKLSGGRPDHGLDERCGRCTKTRQERDERVRTCGRGCGGKRERYFPERLVGKDFPTQTESSTERGKTRGKN